MRSLIVQALDQTYGPKKKGKYSYRSYGEGQRETRPQFPVDENPYDVIFS